jgi:excinuclease UvrABC ATPase subunit
VERTAKELRDAILNGTKEPIKFVYDDGVRRYETTKNFEGVLPNLERRWKETDSPGCARTWSATKAKRPARCAKASA